MAYIFIDKEEESGGQMRQQMRRNMRSGNYRYYPSYPMMRGDNYEHGYRMGYKHGYEDSEEDMDDMEMRRRRDSMGRYR